MTPPRFPLSWLPALAFVSASFVIISEAASTAEEETMKLRCTGEFNFDTTITLVPDSGMAVFSRFPTFRNGGEKATVESDVESDLYYEGQRFNGAFVITPIQTHINLVLDMDITPSPLIFEWNGKTGERRPIGACVIQE